MSAALYIHTPFCIKRCSYCDFYSELYRPEFAEKFARALTAEIALYSNHPVFSNSDIGTIYMGGGTPSVLPIQSIDKILQHIIDSFPLKSQCEITVEINPETIDLDYLRNLRNIGVNRLSIGAQSFSDEELNILGRIHDAAQARKSIEQARQAGFDNLSLDLIFAIPGQRLKDWERSLKQAIQLSPEHLSMYCLTVEPGTLLQKKISNGTLRKADDETERAMYLKSIERLNSSGFRHYEISNFAKPGMECRHNKKYWDGSPYLGLGPSAHSYWPGFRRWNVADVAEYFSLISAGELPVHGSEKLSDEQQIFEFIMLSLRTAEGVNMQKFEKRFGFRFEEKYKRTIEELHNAHENPLIRADAKYFSLTTEGFVLYDEICSHFISE